MGQLVAVRDSGGLLLGECTWTSRQVGTNVLDTLIDKTAAVQADLRRSTDEVCYALWSRSGFTPALVRRAENEGVLLFDVQALCAEPPR